MNLFKRRLVYTKIDNKLIGARISYDGLPQGAVLSPQLFNIYTADIHSIFNTDIRLLTIFVYMFQIQIS
jgi:hypothetical protein